MVHDQRKALRKTLADGTCYGIGVFCVTGEQKEQIGWVPEKEQSLFDAIGMAYNLPNLLQKFIVQAVRILEISLQRQQLLSFVKYHDLLLFIHCLHYKFYIIVVYINSSKERHILSFV